MIATVGAQWVLSLARAVVVGAVLVAVGACGGDDDDAGSVAPADPASTTSTVVEPPTTAREPASPTSVAVEQAVVEEAAQRYLDLVEAPNEVVDHAHAVFGRADSESDVDEIRTAAAQLADAAREIALALERETWPESVAGDFDDYVDALLRETPVLDELAQAATLEDAVALISDVSILEADAAVDRLRRKLGLPTT